MSSSKASGRPRGTSRCAPQGRRTSVWWCVAARAGPKVEVNLPRLFFKQIEIIGSTMGSYEEFAVPDEPRRRRGLPIQVDGVFGSDRLPQGRSNGLDRGEQLRQDRATPPDPMSDARRSSRQRVCQSIDAARSPARRPRTASTPIRNSASPSTTRTICLTGVLAGRRSRHHCAGVRPAHYCQPLRVQPGYDRRGVLRVRRTARHRPRLRSQHHRRRRAAAPASPWPKRRRRRRRGRRVSARPAEEGGGGQGAHGCSGGASTASTPR